MQFSISLPNPDHLSAVEELSEWARAVEEAGLDACAVTDHPFPVLDETDTGHHSLDPFAALTFIGTHTRSIKLHANLVVLPYRNPFLTTNSALTVQALTGGRLILALGSGYLEPEFRALGVDFSDRNRLFDEYLDAIRQAWGGKPYVGKGDGWQADGNTTWNAGAKVPLPQIWIGGNTDTAIRRAARADAWSPVLNPVARSHQIHTRAINDIATLASRIQVLRAECERVGRPSLPEICVVRARGALLHSTGEQLLDEIGRLGELGVTWITMGSAAGNLSEWRDRLQELASLVGRS